MNVKPVIVLVSAVATLFYIGLPLCQAAESDNPSRTSPAVELQKFRTQFLADFQRINLNTTPGDAEFLRLMVEVTGAKRGVEIGTATGYGALFMGLGFERNNGELVTIDIDSKMVAVARDNIAEMKLDEIVTVREGDALKVIPTLTGKFDFVFIDAVKQDYLKYFQALEPLLEAEAVIVADNVIRSARHMQDFFEAVKSSPNYRMVTIRASDLKEDGMAIIYKIR